MKLKSFEVKEFKSVWSSGEVDVSQITCLVGKNEAGKTALLQALYRLNPIVEADGDFDVTLDYPRMEVENYRHEVEAGETSVAVPIKATFELDTELARIRETFGPSVATQFSLSKNYDNKLKYIYSVDRTKSLSHMIQVADLSEEARTAVGSAPQTVEGMLSALNDQEQTEEVKRLVGILDVMKKRNVEGYIYDTFIAPGLPKFLYFDEYYQMTGHENINALIQRQAESKLKSSDHPLLGLVKLARLELKQLLNPQSAIELKGKLQGASNHLSKQVLKYWSQNRHLLMEFDVRPAMPGDPVGMREGTNIWGGVYDTRHGVTTELGSRSRGFVWFFSFLAWYSDVRRSKESLVLLLDEPGLTLHAKAQQDLLKYFETELKEQHQLIYTTHSPFMIDPEHFERVRIVQDKSIESEVDLGENEGTRVLADTMSASQDSLFPLQGALGYELHQTLFVGPFSLVVEGAADLLYIQAMSSLLQLDGKEGLDPRWTITPVGGSSKVPTFVALLGSQKGMTIATLIDRAVSDKDKIEALYREKLLKKANVFTFSDFTGTDEADIEDMFGSAFFVALVNGEFAKQLAAPIDPKALGTKPPRVLQRLEGYLDKNPLTSGKFSHFRPARYFNENLGKMGKAVPTDAKKRFQAAFDALNALLPK